MSKTTDIRKISVGKDFPDGSLHYQVGKSIKLNNNFYVIAAILPNKEEEAKGKSAYDIYISNSLGTVLWKTVIDVPVVIENNIDFE
jgi:hypothetical protein